MDITVLLGLVAVAFTITLLVFGYMVFGRAEANGQEDDRGHQVAKPEK